MSANYVSAVTGNGVFYYITIFHLLRSNSDPLSDLLFPLPG